MVYRGVGSGTAELHAKRGKSQRRIAVSSVPNDDVAKLGIGFDEEAGTTQNGDIRKRARNERKPPTLGRMHSEIQLSQDTWRSMGSPSQTPSTATIRSTKSDAPAALEVAAASSEEVYRVDAKPVRTMTAATNRCST